MESIFEFGGYPMYKWNEHVRLPLTSKHYLLKKLSEESLLKNNPKCKFYRLL